MASCFVQNPNIFDIQYHKIETCRISSHLKHLNTWIYYILLKTFHWLSKSALKSHSEELQLALSTTQKLANMWSQEQGSTIKNNSHTPTYTKSSLSDLKRDLRPVRWCRGVQWGGGREEEMLRSQANMSSRRDGEAEGGRGAQSSRYTARGERRNRLKHPGEECSVCRTPSIRHWQK